MTHQCSQEASPETLQDPTLSPPGCTAGDFHSCIGANHPKKREILARAHLSAHLRGKPSLTLSPLNPHTGGRPSLLTPHSASSLPRV